MRKTVPMSLDWSLALFCSDDFILVVPIVITHNVSVKDFQANVKETVPILNELHPNTTVIVLRKLKVCNVNCNVCVCKWRLSVCNRVDLSHLL